MKNVFLYFFTILLILAFKNSSSQNENNEFLVTCVGFYNLENLFDTIVDEDTTKILQEDFTPNGEKKWNSERYHKKLNNIAKVISEIGTEVTPHGVAILGVAEIENKLVLEDLINQPKIKDRNYKIVHYNSPDKRGVDVGLLYNPNYFTVESSQSFTLKIKDKPDFFSRDQLLVSGKLNNGEILHVIVCHWPSRRGGEKKSRPLREAAADLSKAIVDSIRNVNNNAKIILMGDLNDDPVNSSVKKHLKASGNKEHSSNNGLMYNPMEALYKKGIGSLAWRDTWNLFDQIILTPSLVDKDYSSYKFYTAKIYNKSYLMQDSGSFKGYPYRTYVGSNFKGGYSDHFPVYIYLVKQK